MDKETVDKVFEYLKQNYLIKSIEPLRWVPFDKVKADFLKDNGI